ncbi:hypothetical protein MBAV_000356 [Candidatus Magnetobacterium bavaricum]|uniref:Uncharacterized protein n=1 Tax=Candidatus Magnetobacterium bavaricum TaxID=29290 RepID=A0A0F3GRE6_9BACT|nr:hypothetical protein MBAV_004165 [Candidatus Magnetobacterium bavaricum]KJU84540.1 hypothetical protein MBAV_003265 [Candidatus Magnetobacterium bavaricum]KJU87449.1 hypothetical protein MBAV_000356 [Candidatus Magnetobacterium bavaricum]
MSEKIIQFLIHNWKTTVCGIFIILPEVFELFGFELTVKQGIALMRITTFVLALASADGDVLKKIIALANNGYGERGGK